MLSSGQQQTFLLRGAFDTILLKDPDILVSMSG